MTTAKHDSIWSPTFAILCLAQLLGYAHHALLTPTIPLYATQLGSSPFVVGLILAAFAATSVLLRPFIGFWTDRWSEAGVLASGCLVMAASLLLFFIPFPEVTMLANGVRGIGWAGLNTGGYSLLASVAPATRRAEASGYYSGVQAGVSILFPAVALWLIDAPLGGFGVVMTLSAALAVTGGLLGVVLGRHLLPKAGGRFSDGASELRLNPFALMERDVWLASVFLFCLNLTLPATTGFLVLYARTIGIENVAWYFVATGATSLLARPVLGRIADKIGSAPSLAAGFALQIFGLLILPGASGLALILIGGVLYAAGNAIGSATTLALAIQRANPQRRGRAMASFSVAYPLSAGVGALLSGGAVEVAGYSWMYFMAAAVAAAGLLAMLIKWPSLKES